MYGDVWSALCAPNVMLVIVQGDPNSVVKEIHFGGFLPAQPIDTQEQTGSVQHDHVSSCFHCYWVGKLNLFSDLLTTHQNICQIVIQFVIDSTKKITLDNVALNECVNHISQGNYVIFI